MIGKEKLEETSIMIDIGSKEVEFYSALVIQFGFIVLFSPYFIPAGFLSYFINLGVIAFTITFYGYMTKRSIGRRCSSIGIWNKIFLYLSYAGVLYNTIVILVPGNNLIGILDSSLREKVVISAFILENLIIFIKFMLGEAVPSVPHWVSLRMNKEKKAKKLYDENLQNTIQTIVKKGSENVFLAKEDKELKNVYDNGYEVQPIYVSKNIRKNGDDVPLLKIE